MPITTTPSLSDAVDAGRVSIASASTPMNSDDGVLSAIGATGAFAFFARNISFSNNKAILREILKRYVQLRAFVCQEYDVWSDQLLHRAVSDGEAIKCVTRDVVVFDVAGFDAPRAWRRSYATTRA